MPEEQRHKPTKRKLERARREGKSLKAPLFAQTVLVSVCFLSLFLSIRLSWVNLKMLLQYVIVEGFRAPQLSLGLAAAVVIGFVLACMTPACMAVLLLEFGQRGIKFESAALRIRPDRLNPVKGLAGLVKGLRQVWQYVCRFILFVLVFFCFFERAITQVPRLFFHSARSEYDLIYSSLLLVVACGTLVLALSAAIELWIRRKQFYAELSMSDDELRREIKDEEGDPFMKSTRRNLYESLALEEIEKRVQKSRVIVVERQEHRTS